METSSTLNNFNKAVNFSFTTTYMGNKIALRIISNEDYYSVLHNDKLIGHIKPGGIRHTWYVVDSHYTPPYLVDEVGNRILAYLSNTKAA
jgi:hypothetical protein